jgi:hypothetical protein
MRRAWLCREGRIQIRILYGGLLSRTRKIEQKELSEDKYVF